MNFENKFARFMRDTGPARFLIPLALALIIFGAILLSFNTDKYVETTGRITAVREGSYDEDNKQQQYDIDFTYDVDGKTYTSTFASLPTKYSVGDTVKVFYDPDEPGKTTNSKAGRIVGPIMIGLGALAGCLGVLSAVKAFKKSKQLDEALPGGRFPGEQFEGYKNAPGISEYYFRYDGHFTKPGYIVEDADRNVIFEGKMTKQAAIGARTYEFHDHTNGTVREHQVGHTVTERFNDEFFSAKSHFKFDGENVWDVLHGRGVRLSTDMHSKFPYLIYNAIRDGQPFAHIETSSIHVHEEDEAEHKLVIPTGSMYYRVWTGTKDFETLFLTVFAISETEQAVVE